MNFSSRLLVTSAFAALAFTPAIMSQGGGGGHGGSKLVQYIKSLPVESISAAERAELIKMRQEEKLARDIYQVFFFVYQQPIFNNIAKAEQSHMNLVKMMLDKYKIPDPITSNAWGVYQDPAFNKLFVQLAGIGLASRTHALAVGAYIEDLDIDDLNKAIKLTNNRDMNTIWQNLNRGSRNHMRSFYGQLTKLGLYYPGVLLPASEIQKIVTSPMESQPVDENGVILK